MSHSIGEKPEGDGGPFGCGESEAQLYCEICARTSKLAGYADTVLSRCPPGLEFAAVRKFDFEAIWIKEKQVNARILALTRSGALRKIFQIGAVDVPCAVSAS